MTSLTENRWLTCKDQDKSSMQRPQDFIWVMMLTLVTWTEEIRFHVVFKSVLNHSTVSRSLLMVGISYFHTTRLQLWYCIRHTTEPVSAGIFDLKSFSVFIYKITCSTVRSWNSVTHWLKLHTVLGLTCWLFLTHMDYFHYFFLCIS